MQHPRALRDDLPTQTLRIDELTLYSGNARQGDVGAISESLQRLGQYRPIVVNVGTHTGRRYEVLAGNHTTQAARALGWDTLQATLIDVDDDTARRIVLVDNRTNDLASNDETALLRLLHELDNDFSGTGYDADSIDELLQSIELNDTHGIFDDDDDEQLDDDELPDEHPERPGKYDDERIIDEAHTFWRQRDFPYPSMSTHEAMQAINRLARTDDDKLQHTATAYGVPDAYHPHRFSTPVAGKCTPLEAFADDDKLRHAIRLTVETGAPVTASRLRSSLGFVRGSQCAANFRPGYALALVRRYAPAGGTWLDTSTGFGGRLVAFAASELTQYVGIDPSTRTHDGNTLMARALGIDDRVRLICKPAEDVHVDELGTRCDFAFTSPPYFSKERYADEQTQSYARYKSGHAWRDGFLLPTMQLQHDALVDGAHAVVNIADVKINDVTYPLEQWTIDAAELAGFELVDTLRFPLSRVPGQGEQAERFESVFVFRKTKG